MGKLYSIYEDYIHPFTAISSLVYIELNVSGAALINKWICWEAVPAISAAGNAEEKFDERLFCRVS
jgi:hypothetical protein